MPGTSYPSIWTRCMANTHEPENNQACWPWSGKKDLWGYGQLNMWVPGLGRAVTMKAHLVAWLAFRAQPTNADELYLFYQELRASGLHLDHTCWSRCCVNIDHLEPVTPSVNMQRRRKKGQQ